MKFIIDAQLPPALARTLRALGCEAFAVRELGLREATDAQLWNYALQHGAAIVTKGEDFAQRCLYGQAQPVIVWLQVDNSSNPALPGRVLPFWPVIMQRLKRGDHLIKVSQRISPKLGEQCFAPNRRRVEGHGTGRKTADKLPPHVTMPRRQRPHF